MPRARGCAGHPPPREAFLAWVRDLLALSSASREKGTWEERDACSNGLMLNVAALMCRLCEPITLGVAPSSLLRGPHASAPPEAAGGDRSDRVGGVAAAYLEDPCSPGGLVVRAGAPALATQQHQHHQHHQPQHHQAAAALQHSFITRVFFLCWESLRLGLVPLLLERTGQ